MLTGAIIGLIVGLIVLFMNNQAKQKKFNTIRQGLPASGVDYAALYHYASPDRFRKSIKFFDSYGVLYLIGDTAYYKTSENAEPVKFNLKECTVQPEEIWRGMKWFSITTPSGEKYYFNSHKTGAFVNNSDETIKGLAAFHAKSKQPVV